MDYKKLLEDKNMTQTEVAEKLGLMRAQVCQIVNHRVQMPHKHRVKFCRIMKIDYDAFEKGKIVNLKTTVKYAKTRKKKSA